MGIDYDIILDSVGECGRQQIWFFFLLWVPSALSAMAVFMYEFIAYIPKHRCYVDGCDNSDYLADHLNFSVPWSDGDPSLCQKYTRSAIEECSADVFSEKSTGCDAWVWDHSHFDSSATIDLEMVCNQDFRRSLAQTLYMAGMTIGSFVFGWSSDRFGRKATLMVTALFLVAGGSLPALVKLTPALFPLFALSRFLSGCGHAGTFMTTFALALEYVGPKYRVLFGIIIETPFAIGGLLVGLVSYLGVKDWTMLSLVLSLPNLLLLSYWWLLPESPRWLIARGRIEQLQTDVNKTASINKTKAPKVEDCQIQDAKEPVKPSIIDLLRPTPILVRSLVMFFNWAVTNMCYYGLTSAASVLLDDIYLNYTLVILVEIPAHFVCVYLLDRWGRRPLLGVCQLLAGTTCIAAGLLSKYPTVQVVFALIGKFGATGSFAIVFVYTAELFPTDIRSTAVGASSTCARIGGLLAPQVAALVTVWEPLPLLILGSISAIGGVLVFMFLPETLGEKLPESMEEALQLGKSKKQLAKENGGFSMNENGGFSE